MRRFLVHITAALCVLSHLIIAPAASAERIAVKKGDTSFMTFAPLTSGLTALTFAWRVDEANYDRAAQLVAGLNSTLTGGTSQVSANDLRTYRQLNGVSLHGEILGRHLLLTLTAPVDDFHEALDLLYLVLQTGEYTSEWYARELQRVLPINATLGRRPDNILDELSNYLFYAPVTDAVTERDWQLEFGWPHVAMLRSDDEEIGKHTGGLIFELLANEEDAAPVEERDVVLPKGVIHVADPSASETLILFVNDTAFRDEADQVGARLLMEYVGANSGSEMFRILRQEMRATYAPRSKFTSISKNRALLSMSATVEASRWPEIADKIDEIYGNVRGGEINAESLAVQFSRMRRSLENGLASNPMALVEYVLHEYPDGQDGGIVLPVLSAYGSADPTQIAANAQTHLPPLEDYLLILVGGGEAPTGRWAENGYCALAPDTPLSTCLDTLISEQQ